MHEYTYYEVKARVGNPGKSTHPFPSALSSKPRPQNTWTHTDRQLLSSVIHRLSFFPQEALFNDSYWDKDDFNK